MADSTEEPGWTPEYERENDPDKIQREVLEMAKEVLKKHNEEGARSAFIQPMPPHAIGGGVGPVFSEISIRAISNGFIVSWEEWMKENGYFVGVGRRKEVFVKDADEALPHLKQAMENLRRMSDNKP